MIIILLCMHYTIIFFLPFRGGLWFVVPAPRRQAVRSFVRQPAAFRSSSSSSSSDRWTAQRVRRRHPRRQVLRKLQRVPEDLIVVVRVQAVVVIQRRQLFPARRPEPARRRRVQGVGGRDQTGNGMTEMMCVYHEHFVIFSFLLQYSAMMFTD